MMEGWYERSMKALQLNGLATLSQETYTMDANKNTNVSADKGLPNSFQLTSGYPIT